MDFNLTSEQQLFQKTVRQFCDENLAPRSREIDTNMCIPDDLLKGMADMGLLGLTIPEKYGGPGGDVTMATLGAMEIGRADISMATAVFYLLEAGWSFILAKYGGEEVCNEVLPKVAAGEAFLGVSTTEPGGGSDIANVKTTARKEGDQWILNGEKTFISGVNEAIRLGGGHLTVARTAPGRTHRDMGFFYVPIDAPGITTGKLENMGRMGISTCWIKFDETPIPQKYMLGDEGKGFYHLMDGFNTARIFVAAACIGCGERVLDMGMEYVKQREAFGVPLAKFEGVQFKVAELYAKLEMVKWQILKGAWMTDEHNANGMFTMNDIAKCVAIGKLYAPEYSFDIVKEVMQWYGAGSYTTEYDLEMGMRGIMSYLVGAEGALNIMRIILARELLGKDFLPYKK